MMWLCLGIHLGLFPPTKHILPIDLQTIHDLLEPAQGYALLTPLQAEEH